MGRKILFVTTDQQRWDAIGANGGRIARTPAVDALAAAGINYRRAHNQNVVCMPARSTMLTGQHVRSHGVTMNGIPLPEDGPDVARLLHEAGYRTALIGKAHFEPSSAPGGPYYENYAASRGLSGPHRGFERMELCAHTGRAGRSLYHYPKWLAEHHPGAAAGFHEYVTPEKTISCRRGGDTGAIQVWHNAIPRELYHTDWVADRVIAFLDTLASDEDWFVWMSFPDPHHPWDPPEEEMHRVRWQDLDLPPGHPGSPDAIRAVLAQKPAHWLAWWEGRFLNAEGGPMMFCPGTLTDDQIREVNARVHVMNELIDEATGRVLDAVARRGWLADTDVIFTTDHGELQGDFGLLYKGPYHTDALMRLPFVWRPAPSAGVAPTEIDDPVGQVDLAPTFCAIAGVEPAEWMQGRALPTTADAGTHERALCEWDSQFPGFGMHLRSIVRDGWLCTTYEESTDGQPNGLEEAWGPQVLNLCGIHYDGTEGELYRLDEDPFQHHNLWDDAATQSVKRDLIADLYDSLPKERTILPVQAPA